MRARRVLAPILLALIAGRARGGVAPEPACSAWQPWDDASLAFDLRPLPAFDLKPEPEACSLSLTLSPADILPVRQAISALVSRELNTSRLFVMRNGENRGVYVPWQGDCVRALALRALSALDPPTFARYREEPLFDLSLYTSGGRPLNDPGAYEAMLRQSEGLLYVLYPGEEWVWPGIELGFQWQVAGSTLTTLSLRPKVFKIDPFVSEEEADAIIRLGSDSLARSPEKHYSDDDKFKNYRTSETGFLSPHHPVVR